MDFAFARKSTIGTMRDTLDALIKQIKEEKKEAPRVSRSTYETRVPSVLAHDGCGRLGTLALMIWGVPTPLDISACNWNVKREMVQPEDYQKYNFEPPSAEEGAKKSVERTGERQWGIHQQRLNPVALMLGVHQRSNWFNQWGESS